LERVGRRVLAALTTQSAAQLERGAELARQGARVGSRSAAAGSFSLPRAPARGVICRPVPNPAPASLSFARRALGVGLAFGLLSAASPGILTRDALWPLALLGVALWARYASLPGRGAALLDFVGGGLAGCGALAWAYYVYPGSLAFLGLGFGLYYAAQGWALRRLASRMPLALAAPLAWLLFETLRASLEPPFGIPWMRLGVHLHAAEAVRGAARVCGVGGLSFALAALAGLLADVWGHLRPLGAANRRTSLALAAACGAAPILIALFAARLAPPPETLDGPRVMLVQPGFEQERKRDPDLAAALHERQLELTAESFAQAEAAGERPCDLVAWGETMYRFYALDPQVPAALAAGARFPSWRPGWPEDFPRWVESAERYWIDERLFGLRPGGGVLPPGAAFVSGVEYITALDGELRMKNSVVLWPGPGQPRRGPASKQHRVPGAETLLGLERRPWVRDTLSRIAGDVPDLAAADGDDPVLAFEGRDGRTWRMGISVCFDNAFDDVFTRPVRTADVDFHAVFSNEAWFELSHEADQMMAFSQLAAIATGRSIVRATQSGISAVIGPDGVEVARLEADGRSKMVAGTLRATVPVPAGQAHSPFEAQADASRRPLTAFVRFERLWTALWLVLGLAAVLRASPRSKA